MQRCKRKTIFNLKLFLMLFTLSIISSGCVTVRRTQSPTFEKGLNLAPSIKTGTKQLAFIEKIQQISNGKIVPVKNSTKSALQAWIMNTNLFSDVNLIDSRKKNESVIIWLEINTNNQLNPDWFGQIYHSSLERQGKTNFWCGLIGTDYNNVKVNIEMRLAYPNNTKKVFSETASFEVVSCALTGINDELKNQMITDIDLCLNSISRQLIESYNIEPNKENPE